MSSFGIAWSGSSGACAPPSARGEITAMNDLAAIRAALMPGGIRQERRLNYLPLLARHGDLLIEQLKAGAAIHAGRLIGSR